MCDEQKKFGGYAGYYCYAKEHLIRYKVPDAFIMLFIREFLDIAKKICLANNDYAKSKTNADYSLLI